MEFIDQLAGRSGAQRFNLASILKSSDLTPQIQQYLGKVYTTLAGTLLLAALGVVAGTVLRIPLLVGFIASLGCTIALGFTSASPTNLNKRYCYLGGAALGQGLTLAPLCAYAAHVAPSLLLTAFLGTSLTFACFTVAAALAKRRSYLFLGGGLSAAVGLMALVRLGSWAFGGGTAAYALELYGGLIVFLGYCIVDTQVIIEKAFAGDRDHIKAALSLFLDFAAVFVRVLVILLRNADQLDGSRNGGKGRADRRDRRRRA